MNRANLLVPQQPVAGLSNVRYLPHITFLGQSPDIRLQWQIIALLGLHGVLTLLEIAQYLYATRPRDELPLATVELALWELRKAGLARRRWLSRKKRFSLSRDGQHLHQEMVKASGRVPGTRFWSDGLLP